MSQYWLVKQEPTAYSWDQFAADGKTDWTGVRNFQARNNLRSMKIGDPVFYYHSVNGKAVVGIAKVTKEAFRDPTAAEGDWSAVELTAVRAIEPPVKVEQIKQEPRLIDIPLLKNSRLSVMKLTKEQFDTILDLAKAVPALAIFAAPGGMLLLPLLVKLLPFSVLPSAWEGRGRAEEHVKKLGP